LADAADADAGLVEAIERQQRAAAERDVPAEERARLARARNCVLALARAGLPLLPEAIQAAFDAAAAAGAPPEAALDAAHAAHAVEAARAVLRSMNAEPGSAR
jgi:hypothetical protein